jgi:aldose sugar dehydrogenase
MLLLPFALLSVFRVTTRSIIILVSLLTPPIGYNDIIITYAQEEIEGVNASIGGEELPSIKDPNLGVQLISEGLEFPTSMAFLGQDDILVLEKEKGTVQRIVNGMILPTPVLTVNVATEVERCMCGIAVSKSDSGTIYVFLYFTEAGGSGVSDFSSEPVGNRLYRYEWINDQLVNPKLLLDLPAIPGPRHNGGVVSIGPDNNVYVIIGDVDGHLTQAQNQESGEEPVDGTSGILRITQDGQPVVSSAGTVGILGNTYPLNLYYAYGIRNSFGFDFDPVTGNTWDTENGPGYGDEINLVEPGFNSGWLEISGLI